MVFVPEGEPPRTNTWYCPSDAEPSEVVSVCVVPESVMSPTPAATRSIISKFVLVDVPHVPDSSPVAIFLYRCLLYRLPCFLPLRCYFVQVVPC